MIAKVINVKDIHLFLANTTMSILSEKEPEVATKVLAELIARSQNSTISARDKTSNQIQKHLNISPEVYRQAIARLKKLKIIIRNESHQLVIHPIASTPFDLIKIKQI